MLARENARETCSGLGLPDLPPGTSITLAMVTGDAVRRTSSALPLAFGLSTIDAFHSFYLPAIQFMLKLY
jgi:hypothetical protein